MCLLSARCGVLCSPEAFPALSFTAWAAGEAPAMCFTCHTSSTALCRRHRRTVHREPSNSPPPFLFVYSKLIYFGPHDLRDLSSPTRDWTHTLGQWKLSPDHWTTRECPTLLIAWLSPSFAGLRGLTLQLLGHQHHLGYVRSGYLGVYLGHCNLLSSMFINHF